MRIKAYEFDSHLLIETLKQGNVCKGFFIKENGFPEDAKIEDIKYDQGRHMICVYVSSSTYQDIRQDPIVVGTI